MVWSASCISLLLLDALGCGGVCRGIGADPLLGDGKALSWASSSVLAAFGSGALTASALADQSPETRQRSPQTPGRLGQLPINAVDLLL